MSCHIQMHTKLGALNLDAAARCHREIIIISGENGSGKTTLLRCLAGLEQAQGLLTVHGQVWLDSAADFVLPVQQRQLGCVWTEAALLPWLSVGKNIVLGAALDAVRLKKLSTQLQISALLQRSPAMLSTGEAQRVSLARAVYRQPEMLLLDEPFSAQAPSIRQHLRTWLKDIQDELNIPILMVSHDLEDAKCLANQHWFMREGRVLSEVHQRQQEKVNNHD